MSDRENQSDGSDTRTDPDSMPSLSGLAKRIEGGQGRPDNAPGDTDGADTDGDPEPATSRTNDDSEFFFPADSAPENGNGSPENGDGSDESSPTLEPIEQELADTPIDGRPVPGQDDALDGPGTEDRNDESDGPLGPDAKTEAIIELTRDVRNLLLMGPPHSPADYELCANLMVPRDDPPEHLLLVTFEKSPDERLNILQGHLGTLPDSIAMLNVGDATRSGSTDIVSTSGTDGISVDNVRDPTDVQRMGLAINKHLSRWDDDGETVLCFHSLSALLNAVDSETVFRFLNVLLGRVRSGEVRAHYHINPDAHEDQILETYRPLFDERLILEEDGSVRIDR